jgi:23S rRNA (guanosine2251-2'-O)-methyltransferase
MSDDALPEEQNAVAGRSAEEGRLLSDGELRRLVGPTVVAAALHARLRRFAAIYVERRSRDRRVQRLTAAAKSRRIAVRFRGRDSLTRLAGGPGHAGVVAFASARPWQTLDELLAAVGDAKPALVVAIEGIEDPFNFGRLLRTAEAGGAAGVLARRRDWGDSSGDVSRVSGGSYERVRLVGVEELAPALEQLRQRGLALIAGTPEGQQLCCAAELTRPLALVVGGERRGVSKHVLAMCDETVRIPTVGSVQSLAACDAAAVLVYEILRQRHRLRADTDPAQEE